MNAGLIALCATGGGAVTVAILPVAQSVRREQPSASDEAGNATLPPRVPPRPLSPLSWATWVLVGAAAFALLAAHFGAVPELGAYCAFAAGGLAVSVVDLRVMLIPRRFVYLAGTLVSLGLLAASLDEHRYRALADAALGGVIAFGAFYLLWFLVPRGIGFGDVRLAALVGVALGWLGLLYLYVGFTAAFLIGSVVGLVLMVGSGAGRKTRFPFGPALALGALVGLVWGHPIIHHVLHGG